MDLVEALLPSGMTRQGVLDKMDIKTLPTFTRGAWGIVAANADNDPNGPDNLFVIVDDLSCKVHALDFLHSKPVPLTSSQRDVLDLLSINIANTKLPVLNTSGFNDRNREVKEGLSNPRGVCTNRLGDFWVADMGKNRVVRYHYDKAKKYLQYVGSLTHLNQPLDVSFSKGFGDFGDLLGIANSNGNSALFVDPDFQGEVDLRSLPEERKGEVRSVNGAYLVRPSAIASDPGNPERLYLAHSGRKIVRLVRTGAFEFAYAHEAEWPIDGEISSIKCDRDGDIFVVDMLSSFIGKYNPDMELVFSSGGYSDGSDAVERNFKTGFNFPKYVYIGGKDDVYFSERWEKYSGLQRFLNWPRFIDKTVLFQLDCQTSLPIEQRSLTFQFELTKKGNVSVRLYKEPDVAGQPHEKLWETTFSGISGRNSFVVPVTTIGAGFVDNGTYSAEFESFDLNHPKESSGLVTHWIHLGAPQFLNNTTVIASEFFNPSLFPAKAEFNISGEAKITFKMVSKDVIGTPSPSQFVNLGASGNFQRIVNGTNVVTLNISPADLSRVPEMDKFVLWAEMESVPCGIKQTIPFPLAGIKYLRLDRTVPTESFDAFTQVGFNPLVSAFSVMGFTFSAHDNSDNNIEFNVGVYKASDLTKPVRTSVLAGILHKDDGAVSYHWNGIGDDGKVCASGQYIISAFVTDLAGNRARINSGSFLLDTDAPSIALSLPALGLNFENFKGTQALLLTSNPVSVGLSIQDKMPKDVTFRLDKISPQDASVVGNFNYGTIFHNGTSWPASFSLDPNTFPGDGIYGLNVYGTDQVGNSSADNPVRTMASPQIGDVHYIWVDHFAPLLTTKLTKSVIRSGGKTDLIISAYHQGVDKPFDFTYTVALYHGTTKLSDFATGKLTPSASTVVLPFNHETYLTRKGKFTFKVDVTANLGRVGNSQNQSVDFYVDAFPPQISGVDGMTVPKKFFLSGQVGDPNLVNDLNQNGFEQYSVYWKEGAITSMPSDLSTWKKTGVFVPFHAIDRNGPNASGFPLGNVGDNQEAITSAFGSASLAYIDGGTTGANFTAGNTYTVLVNVKERGKALEFTSATTALRTFKVENPSTLKIDNIDMNGTGSGPVAFDAANGTLRISGSLSGGLAQQAFLRLYIYSKDADIDGDGLAEPIAIRLEKSDVKPGSPFSFQWDGKDGKGSFVKDGVYRVALILEQAPSGRGEGPFDSRIIDDRDVAVKTPLRLVEGTLTPTTISSAPTASGVAGNTAGFKYKATKPSYTYLEIQDKDGNKLFDVGPERNQDGAGVFHILAWNATDPGNGLPVAEGEYRLKPYAVSKIGDAAKYYYGIPDSPLGYYKVIVTAPQSETPELGGFAMFQNYFGNSDAIWSSKPSGLLWKMNPATLNTSVSIKMNGTQTLKRNQSSLFRGTYFRQHTLLQYRAAARFAIGRNRICSVLGIDKETRGAAGGNPVVQTYSWNFPSVALSTSQAHTTSDRTFTNPDWHLDDGSETPIGPDWGGGDCAGGFGSWRQSYGTAENRWGAIYALDGTLMDVIFTTGTYRPPEVSNPTGLFSGANFSDFTSSSVYRTTFRYNVSAGGGLSESGYLTEHALYPGQSYSGTVPAKDFGITGKIIDREGYKVTVAFTLPPQGTITFTKPYPYSFTNPGPTNEFFAVFQAGPVSPTDKLAMPISYTYSLDSHAPVQTVDVAGVPFPFPPKTGTVPGCGLVSFPDANNVPGVDIWASTQAWVLNQSGDPDAYFANSSCDFVRNLPLSLTLQPGETREIPLAGLIADLGAHSVAIQSYLFSNNTSQSTIVINGVQVLLKIERDKLKISYPVDGLQASRIAWNPPLDPADADPILAAKGSAVQGYMMIGSQREVFSPYDLSTQAGFTNPDFAPVGKTQNLFDAYTATATARLLPIPNAASTNGDAWKQNQSAWKFMLWDDGAGSKGFHWDLGNSKGLDFGSWSPISFKYIDGSLNDDYEVPPARDNRTAGTFVPEIKALATPKRIVPINFRVDLDGIQVTSIAACPIGISKGTWEPISVSLGSEVIASGTVRTLGFWDITNKAGAYYIRVLAKDAANKPYQVTGTVKIGTEVKDHLTSDQIIPSPLKQAMLIFPPNSKYSGLMSVNPVNPKNLPGFEFGNVPKGVVVDVTPSGLIFDEANADDRPQLVFFLRTKDIVAMGGQPDRLGEIGIYYLNEKTKALEKAPFAPAVYNLDDPAHTLTIEQNPTLTENQILQLKGGLQHTSLYGSFSLSTFVTINPVVAQTAASTISLSGTGSQAAQSAGVYLYVSQNPVWNTTATLVGSAAVSSEGVWSWPSFPLPYEGKNYIYASIGAAVLGSHEPTNSTVVSKDGTKPTVNLVSFDPPVLGMQATAAQINVMLSEVGDATLFIPSIFGSSFTSRTRSENATASFSIPLTNLDGGVLDEGEYPVFVTATDLVGNQTETTSRATLAVDRTPPTLAVDPITLAGRISGSLKDNYKLGQIRTFDQNGNPVTVQDLSGTSSNWTLRLVPSEFPSMIGKLRIVGVDMAGNASQEVLIPLGKIFPTPLDTTFAVSMRDNRYQHADGAQPEILITNHSSKPISGFRLRLWLSREEAPQLDVAVDPYLSIPCGIRFFASPHPDNANLVMVDVLYPSTFVLEPGQTSAPQGLTFGLHYRNPGLSPWLKTNDWSWQGISSEFAPARNVTLYDSEGKLLYGREPDVFAVPAPPSTSSPPAANPRITYALQSLYLFHEGYGATAADISGSGIPLDLHYVGQNAAWIHTGGFVFAGPNHHAILENRTPNPKLFQSVVAANKVTLEAWIAPANFTQQSASILEYGSASGAPERNFEMIQTGRNLEFRLRTASSSTISLVTTNGPIAAVGQRYHVVMSYEPYSSSTGKGGMRIFVNGNQVASNRECGAIVGSSTNAWNPAYRFFIGNRPVNLDRGWEGSLLLVAVYASAFSAQDVAKNWGAGVYEPTLPVSPLLGIACQDRVIPEDIIDGQKPWIEDRAADNNSIKMGGTAYSKGLGGQPGPMGSTSFLIYDLEKEGRRVGQSASAARLTGFVGMQDSAVNSNIWIKVSHAIRKPSDQDWLNNTGSVLPLFTSNGGSNLPIDLDIAGAKWLFLGQQAIGSVSNAQGDFAELRLRFSGSADSGMVPEFNAGLEYKYYEGTWDRLPDFNTMTPLQHGLVGAFDLSPRLRNDHFAFVFDGFIRIKSAGTYTFSSNSDDGSQIFIDGQLVVNNDGLHSITEKSGSILLGTGMHSIRVTYFDKDNAHVLEVSYQGPGIHKAPISALALFHPSTGTISEPIRVESGLQAYYNFTEKPGPSTYDLSPAGVPLDLELSGTNAVWLEGGGVAFQGTDHNTSLQSRSINPKLFNAIVQSDELTIEAWIMTANLSQSGSRRIVEYGNAAGLDERDLAMVQEGQNLQFKLRNYINVNSVLSTTGCPLASGASRYHVVMTYKPYNAITGIGGMQIYVNGVLQASNTLNGTLEGTGTNAWKSDHVLAVGNRAGGLDKDWDGRIYLLAVYDRALSASQVKGNYDAGIPSRFAEEQVALGVTTLDRLLPARIQDGSLYWQEDKAVDGANLRMGGSRYALGLGGVPGGAGQFSWLLYDLDRERNAFGISGTPQRLTGFLGKQDATGTVQQYIKTSGATSEPTLSSWLDNSGGVIQRLFSDNGSNVPINLDLNGIRWLWIAQSSTDPGNPGQGVFGQAKIHFGPVPAPSFSAKLAYKYVEGAWERLPDFDGMQPIKGGFIEDFNTGPKNRSDNYAIEYKGFLQISSAGTYTFYTNSDDGSRLWVDGAEIVGNDGLHAAQECSGNVTLATGMHAIKVQFFQREGGELLDVQYQGPGISKKEIPAEVLFHSDAYVYGLEAKYYEGVWNAVPEFETLVVASSDVRNNFRLNPKAKADGFGFAFNGNIFIPMGGSYTFFTNSDDGSKLFIDGSLVVSNDGLHYAKEKSGTVSLAQGFHKIRIVYFDNSGTDVLEARMQGPSMPKVLIPAEMLFRESSLTLNPPNTGKDAAIVMGGENLDRNYTLSDTHWFKIPLGLYTNSWAKRVVVALDDMNGRVMEGRFRFENGSAQTIEGWYKSYSTDYTGQNELYFIIQVPASRLYKVRWWFE